MLFNTYEFIFLFLPLALFVYQLLGRRGRRELAFLWVVAMSLLLYGWWEPRHVPLLLGSVAFNYGLGAALARRPSRVRLALGITGNVACLGYFKYTSFLVENANRLAGTSFSAPDILLPAAISFFTFQQIAYLVDAHRGLAGERSFLRYLLFVTFFPQLVIGPIVHHSETMPQFGKRALFGSLERNLAVGLTIFAIGLFKKVILGDLSGLYADPVFAAAERGAPLALLDAWVGASAFSFQIYFDFSGYSDMAIGLARMFGIRLPLNFDSPYRTTNITDFWRHWHITLTRFLGDYVYAPLNHGAPPRWRRYANAVIVMWIAGLWHGASWLFVLWGFLHGAYLVIQKSWRRITGPIRPRFEHHPAYVWGCRALLFAACTLAWVPFRADTLDGALALWAAMTHGPAVGSLWASLGAVGPFAELRGLWMGQAGRLAALPGEPVLWLGLLLAVVWCFPNTQEIMARQRPALGWTRRKTPRRPTWLVWRPATAWALALTALFVLSSLWMGQTEAFIYYQF